jgi:hypothetical protein
MDARAAIARRNQETCAPGHGGTLNISRHRRTLNFVPRGALCNLLIH